MKSWHLNLSQKSAEIKSTSEIAKQVAYYFKGQCIQAILFFQAIALAIAI